MVGNSDDAYTTATTGGTTYYPVSKYEAIDYHEESEAVVACGYTMSIALLGQGDNSKLESTSTFTSDAAIPKPLITLYDSVLNR